MKVKVTGSSLLRCPGLFALLLKVATLQGSNTAGIVLTDVQAGRRSIKLRADDRRILKRISVARARCKRVATGDTAGATPRGLNA